MAIIKNEFRDIEIERQVMAYLVRKDKRKHAYLKGSDFSVKPFRELFNFLGKGDGLWEMKDVLLHALRKERFLGFDQDTYNTYLTQLYSIDVEKISEEAFLKACNTLRDYANSRYVVLKIKKVLKSINEDSFDMEQAQNALKQAYTLTITNLSSTYVDYIEGYKERKKIVRKRGEGRDEGKGTNIKTGVERFDNITGGLLLSEFGVVAGGPGVGKTSFLIHIAAKNWLQKKSVLFITGEMKKEEIEFRFDSLFSGVEATKFRLGSMEEKDWKKWEKEINKLSLLQDNFLEVVAFPRRFDAGVIEKAIVQIQEIKERVVDLICIDYINIMEAKDIKTLSIKDWRSQADVIWDVKELAAEKNCVIWTAGQLTDAALEKDVLSIEDLKYARAIGETSPVVVGLVRTEDDRLENVIQLQVLKLRSSPLPSTSIFLHPRLSVMRIHEEYKRMGDLAQDVDSRSEGRAMKSRMRREKRL
jgi:replicative DNA helicase